jgi:DNA replication licensing factor MCM5
MAQGAFDGSRVYTSDQGLTNEEVVQRASILKAGQEKFMLFLRDWTRGNTFFYREQLIKQANKGEPLIEVDIEDISAFDENLFQLILSDTSEVLDALDRGASEVCNLLTTLTLNFQVSLISQQRPISLRELSSDLVGKLIVVPGIVVAVSKPSTKVTTVVAQCRFCQTKRTLLVDPGFSGIDLPRICNGPLDPQGAREKCGLDPFVIIGEECRYIDQQTLKVQERPEDVPTGEMPRTVTAVLDKYLVDKVAPGSRVTLVSIFSVFGNAKNSSPKNSYLRGIGIVIDHSEQGRYRNFYTIEDEEEFHAMSRDPELVKKIQKSIAPSVFGNEDIKKAISCLLFGGTRKSLQDGTKLRGDINVLLIGDPSTAKSQFLKFVARVSPIAVYTSGKGSSAAGLTASVVRDNASREFQLEGGAMVLADGGVVCIDEFDKMKPDDRVAIHEAMEQQTISVAKAGITTILNSRTSVLAAANPIHGSYDDLKQAQEQIDLQSTILSRFDCIFLVRDIRNEQNDREMATHVVNLHMGNTISLDEQGDIDMNLLRKYIAFARSKCFPKLQEDSMKLLQNFYVADRKKQANGAFPITVRQLEAIIRLSESLAKMTLSTIVRPEHVEEAHRLFEVSTINASSAGLSASGVSVPREMAEQIVKIEEVVRRKVSIGTKISKAKLEQELLTIFADHRAIEMALVNMIKRDEFQQRDGWRLLIRMR